MAIETHRKPRVRGLRDRGWTIGSKLFSRLTVLLSTQETPQLSSGLVDDVVLEHLIDLGRFISGIE